MVNGSKEFCQEYMTDVVVPDSDRLGDVDEGWTVGIRWMFHERMLMNSPFVTIPLGTPMSGLPSAVRSIAAAAGRLDDPRARDLVGEARMLDLVGASLGRRLRDGIASGEMSDQAGAIGRLFTATATARRTSIAFEIAAEAGGTWAADDGDVADCGTDFLMRQVSCIGGGTTEMARNVISERVLGMPANRRSTVACPSGRCRGGGRARPRPTGSMSAQRRGGGGSRRASMSWRPISRVSEREEPKSSSSTSTRRT